MEHVTDGDKYKRQLSLELEMQGLGCEAFRKRVQDAREKSREDKTNYGVIMVSQGIDKVSEGIRDFIKHVEGGRAGRKHVSYKYIKDIDADVASFIGLRAIIEGVTSQNRLQNTAEQIADWLEDEARFRHFEEEDKVTFKKVQKNIVKVGNYRHKSRVMVHMMNKAGVEWQPWPKKDKVLVGIKMIDIIIERTGYVRTETIYKNKNNKFTFLSASDTLMEWIDKQCARSELLNPQYLPTIISPRNWTSPINGGYHSTAVPQLKLVKTTDNSYIEDLIAGKHDLTNVYEMVNALQNTAWKINKPVLDVIDTIWCQGLHIGKMPSRSNHELPVKPHDIADNEIARRTWKKTASKVHEANNRSKSKRIQTSKTLWIARKFMDEDEIFFPSQLDFRGRVYCVPNFLNPQGTDYAKALLTFSKGKPIEDAVAAGWLAIQGANTFGYDKSNLEDRIQFIEDKSEEIIAVVEDPMENIELWKDADEPFQYLAFCFEWAGFLREGYGFVSSLPIAMDGSNNGLQNFAAMLRDTVSGEAVNLTNNSEPADIYQRVADVVVDNLESMTEHLTEPFHEMSDEEKFAVNWIKFGVNRKMTKRPVMVLPYGGTIFSCREYVSDYLAECALEGRKPDWDETLDFKAAVFMADKIWEAIGGVVVAARQAMDWLQNTARVASKEDVNKLEWTAPSGFHCVQSYSQMDSKRITTKLGDGTVKLSVLEQNNKSNNRKQINAVSPNFIHSMDAAHLTISVCYAVDNDIESFAMVHDSYGTVAADANLMSHCLRHAFCDMYTENDVLEDFKNAVDAALPEERTHHIPPLPMKGNLDIEEVKTSNFFFA